MSSRNPLQRAFELAREGHARSVEDLRRKLKEEGFENVDGHLAGASIKRQLKEQLAAPSRASDKA